VSISTFLQVVTTALLVAFPGFAQTDGSTSRPSFLGPGPMWRGPVRPTASNEVFATGNGCSMCHSAAHGATAMRNATGDDVSPHGLWQATMMANSHRDPYWRATVDKEVRARPDVAAETEASCLRCHAPMAHHTARLGGQPALSMKDALKDPLAVDGVSCTVCHKIEATGLGEPSTWNGHPPIGRDRAIYGPFKDPAAGPMKMHSGYEPQQGMQIRTSAHCATCHTLTTHHAPDAPGFREQTPYLEWRNSDFSTEVPNKSLAANCQDCHMADMGNVRIARNPAGRDFLIEPRPFRAHAFTGGNAFMLDLFAKHREELGVSASVEALERMARATRSQLSERTATVAVTNLKHMDGHLSFDVTVRNLTGHKLPTGYPARRMWLEVQVRAGNELVFHGGAPDEDGSLKGVTDELDLPHVDVVRSAKQIPVYEQVAADAAGRPTTTLGLMATKRKDTRILPAGWKSDGPHAADTAPVGIGDDANFVGGSDTVSYELLVNPGKTGRIRVLAYLRYQPIPPAWIADLKNVDTEDARRFVRMYEEADRGPETITIGQAFED